MSKRKKKARSNQQPSKVLQFPDRQSQGSPRGQEQKLSEIILDMALRLLKNPEAFSTTSVAHGAAILASAAWNCAVKDIALSDQHVDIIGRIDWNDLRAELRSDDTDQLIAELIRHKRDRYPDDYRRVVSTELGPEGNLRVHWVMPEEQEKQDGKVVTAAFESTTRRPQDGRTPRGRPIAEKLVRKMKKKLRAKLVNLQEVMTGRANAEKLQKTIAGPEELADFHPAHAVYVITQNQISVMSEQLTGLHDMAGFVKIIAKAEEEYMPGGPPISPLTTSFFTCWAFFDVCVGLAEETIATTAMAVGAAFGMRDDLLRLMGLMQQSRMGIYVHDGAEGDLVIFRELVTDAVYRTIVPTGYRGKRGELWYVRILPPPGAGSEHVVFTTPYLLLHPGEREWQAYFRRTLPDYPLAERIASYERHMKYGPTRYYWTEFVLEAYVNHQTEVIFLAGLPDVAESRPHSRVNRQARLDG